MNNYLRYITLFLLTLPLHLHAAEDEEIRVLFVGNSYTYYWNMPLQVTLMADSLGKKVFTKQSTVGSSNLEEHWKGERETQTRAIIEQGDWDFVVLNNHSLSAKDTPESFREYGLKFAKLIKQTGAKPVFYMTWPRKHNRLMLKTISESYREIANASAAELVAVGELWNKSISLHPEKNLYARDESHPSPQGSYLAALAFTKFFTGLSVQEVPDKLFIKDANGDKLYIAIMDENNGAYFRDLVDSWAIK